MRALIILLIFLGLPYFVFQSTALHRFLIRTAADRLGVDVTFQNSRLILFTGEIRIDQLNLKGPQDRFRLSAEKFRLAISPFSLLRGKLIFSHIDFDGSTLEISKTTPKPVAPFSPEKLFNQLQKSTLLQNLSVRQLRLRSFTVFSSSAKIWNIEELKIQAEPNLLREVSGTVHLQGLKQEDRRVLDELTADLTLSAKGIELKEFHLTKEKVSLEASGKFDGTSQQGNLQLKGVLLAETVLSEPLKLSLNGALEKNLFTVKELSARLGEAALQAGGNVDLGAQEVRLDFTAHDLPLESIFQKLPGPLLHHSQGLANLHGAVRGPFTSALVEAEATIQNFRHRSLLAQRAVGPVRLHWPRLEFDASVRPAADDREQLHVTGSVEFGHLPGLTKLQALPQTIHILFNETSLAAVLPESKLQGNLTGELQLKGEETSVVGTGRGRVINGSIGPLLVDSLESLIKIEKGGEVSLRQTVVQISGNDTTIPGEIRIESEAGVTHFFGNPTTESSLDGFYRQPENGVEARLQGKLPLAWLQFFPHYVREASGTAQGDLTLYGPPEGLALKGTLQLAGGEISFRGIRGLITDPTGSLRSDGSQISGDLHGNWEGGAFHLKGGIEVDHFQPRSFDLELHGTNLSAAKSDLWRADFDADVTLQGSLPSPWLRGEIAILDGRYVKKFLIRELVLSPAVSRQAKEEWEKAVGPFRIDLHIHNRGETRVQNNIALILLNLDLFASGTYAQPKLLGEITTLEGTFHYLGHDFELTEGRLEFSDPDRSEPYLTLKTEQQVSETHTVFLNIRGYLSNLEIELSSVPSLPREDIVSLMTLGMTEEEVRASGTRRSVLSSKILAGEISSVFEKPLASATGLDIVRLEASEGGSLGNEATTLSRVALGKRVTDRLSLEFKSDFAPETAERTFQANYYLTDNILLKGFRTRTATTESRYQFNLSLRFRLQ